MPGIMTQRENSAPVGALPFLLAVLLMFAPIRTDAAKPVQCGKASWYEFTSRTASGEMADPEALAAAHPSLPFGTKVIVKNMRNGRAVTVRINDRGPHTGGRIIDVTRAAAKELGLIAAGIGQVMVAVVDQDGAEADAGCP